MATIQGFNSRNDTLNGSPSNDILYGYGGNDSLFGRAGNDYLYGGNGSDYLNGYGSFIDRDVLYGGAGSDTFVLGDRTNGIFYQLSGYAIIADWNFREDYIQVRGSTSQYRLTTSSVANFGSSAPETLIWYQNDVIGVVVDSTNVMFSRDFISV